MGQLVLAAGTFQLVLLAVVVRRLLARGGGPPRTPMGKRNLSRNREVGARLVAEGLITRAQLQTALQHQQALAARGRYVWLGEVLEELGYMRAGDIKG